ncbi:MAG: Rieske (2Fe-2S) protein [Mucilaginibacter polytrichastri]|nr:Rieske (2Fe-2S) protein [Mucilaginibacter polytrichastri]
MNTRRAFIKKGCLACMGVAGASFFLESCGSTLPLVKTAAADNLIRVPVARFTDNPNNMVIVRSAQLEHDILLVKQAPETYNALYLQCTHEGYNLTPTAKKIYCNEHGSVFDLQGNVMQDPAQKPLKKFKTENTSGEIIIHLI